MSTTFKSKIQELQTLRDMVRWGATEFNAAQLHFGHGIANAWDEALYLARHVLHLSPADDSRAADARLLHTEKAQIADFFARRIQERKPAAYLTQEAWFMDLPFYVDERVIVPRSPIAELIENQFAPWLDGVEVKHVLDMCTGSGCIAIACAYAFPIAEIDAADISKAALEVAKINVEKHGLIHSVHLHHSDLFQSLPKKSYQLIVSNPPYVDATDMRNLPEEFLHEPQLALAAGDNGLDIVTRILEHAKEYLTDDGILVVEVGNSAHALEAEFPQLPFIWLEFENGGHGVFLLRREDL